MRRSAGTHRHALPHCMSLYLLMCKECAACCIAARNFIEQQITLSRLLQELFGPGYGRQPEKGLGERRLHDEPRQTLDRSCAGVQGHAGGVLWSELPAWNITSHVLSETCKSFASRFGAQTDIWGMQHLMQHLDSMLSLTSEVGPPFPNAAADSEACVLVTADKGPGNLAYHGQQGQSSCPHLVHMHYVCTAMRWRP